MSSHNSVPSNGNRLHGGDGLDPAPHRGGLDRPPLSSALSFGSGMASLSLSSRDDEEEQGNISAPAVPGTSIPSLEQDRYDSDHTGRHLDGQSILSSAWPSSQAEPFADDPASQFLFAAQSDPFQMPRHQEQSVDSEISGASTQANSRRRESRGQERRHKWTADETDALVTGCTQYGVGNWKAILNDPRLKPRFHTDRNPGDLKDRFRTKFPDAYHQLYPNAKTHMPSGSSRRSSEGHVKAAHFEKGKSKERRCFSAEEDAVLLHGYGLYGSSWTIIARDPVFGGRRKATDLRDRFRNAFPELYEQAGYKPRAKASKGKDARLSHGSSHALYSHHDHAVQLPDSKDSANADLNSVVLPTASSAPPTRPDLDRSTSSSIASTTSASLSSESESGHMRGPDSLFEKEFLDGRGWVPDAHSLTAPDTHSRSLSFSSAMPTQTSNGSGLRPALPSQWSMPTDQSTASFSQAVEDSRFADNVFAGGSIFAAPMAPTVAERIGLEDQGDAPQNSAQSTSSITDDTGRLASWQLRQASAWSHKLRADQRHQAAAVAADSRKAPHGIGSAGAGLRRTQSSKRAKSKLAGGSKSASRGTTEGQASGSSTSVRDLESGFLSDSALPDYASAGPGGADANAGASMGLDDIEPEQLAQIRALLQGSGTIYPAFGAGAGDGDGGSSFSNNFDASRLDSVTKMAGHDPVGISHLRPPSELSGSSSSASASASRPLSPLHMPSSSATSLSASSPQGPYSSNGHLVDRSAGVENMSFEERLRELQGSLVGQDGLRPDAADQPGSGPDSTLTKQSSDALGLAPSARFISEGREVDSSSLEPMERSLMFHLMASGSNSPFGGDEWAFFRDSMAGPARSESSVATESNSSVGNGGSNYMNNDTGASGGSGYSFGDEDGQRSATSLSHHSSASSSTSFTSSGASDDEYERDDEGGEDEEEDVDNQGDDGEGEDHDEDGEGSEDEDEDEDEDGLLPRTATIQPKRPLEQQQPLAFDEATLSSMQGNPASLDAWHSGELQAPLHDGLQQGQRHLDDSKASGELAQDFNSASAGLDPGLSGKGRRKSTDTLRDAFGFTGENGYPIVDTAADIPARSNGYASASQYKTTSSHDVETSRNPAAS